MNPTSERGRWLPALALGALILACTAAASVAADVRPAVERPLSAVELIEAPLTGLAELAAEDEQRAAEGLPYRFAASEDVQLTPQNSGTWDIAADGSDVWRLRIDAAGALSLNLGFTVYHLPPGATLLLESASDPRQRVVFDHTDNAGHGQLWTPVMSTDGLVLWLTVPEDRRVDVALELGRIGRGYRGFGDLAKSGACNIDVACPQGDAWRDEIASVGVYTVDGRWMCTGAMINNTAQDGRPLFLTAFHCGVTETAAPSVVVYWNYESPTCGQQGGGSLDQFNSGTTLLADWVTSDFALLELSQRPDPSFGVKYAGWDRSGAIPTAAVAIHHPSTDEKSISFENDPLTRTQYLQSVEDPAGHYLRVIDWDEGTTEGGSSGSPLFDPQHRIVGQLRGGFAACGNNLSDWYGRISGSWAGDGDSRHRLSDSLDPAGTGAVTLDLLDPQAAGFTVTPASGLEASGTEGGPFSPASATWTLTNNDLSVAVPFAATSDASWLQVTPATGTVPAGGSITVTATLDAGSLAAGHYAATVSIDNTLLGPGSAERTVTLTVIDAQPVLLHAAPNPFRGLVDVHFSVGRAAPVTWRVLDMKGRLVLGPRVFDAVAGENTITWAGRDSANRRLPSGRYVLEFEAAGRVQRAHLTLVR